MIVSHVILDQDRLDQDRLDHDRIDRIVEVKDGLVVTAMTTHV